MKYLLDTSTLSDVINNIPAVSSRVFGFSPDLMAVSTITIMEIEFGLALNPAKIVKIGPKFSSFFKSIHVLPFSEEDAKSSGIIRAGLRKMGKPIGAYDVLLAGSALARGLIFVTSNIREFEQVPDLQLEDWRQNQL